MADANVEKEMPPSQEGHSVLDSAQETATATAPAECGLDLEAKKQRLLEELESALLPSKAIPRNDDDDSDKHTVETQQAPIPVGASIGLGLGLGFEVIDETALVDTLSLPSSAAAAPANGFGKGKKGSGANVKNNKQSSSRRRAKKDATLRHKNGNGKNNAAASTEEEEEEEAPKKNENANGKKKRRYRYSRKEMEALRFANVEKQRAFWNAIHAGLEPLVAAVAPVPLPLPLCHLPNKKQPAPPILGVGAANGRWRYMNVFVH